MEPGPAVKRARPWSAMGKPLFDESEFSAYEVDEDQRQVLDRFKQSIFKEHDALACRFSGFTEFQNKFRSHLVKRLLDIAPLSSTINLDEQLEADVSPVPRRFLTRTDGFLTLAPFRGDS
jgi:hypothetical protein